jgi:hypothetical protein
MITFDQLRKARAAALWPVVWPSVACVVLALAAGSLTWWLHRVASGLGFAAGVGLAGASFALSALVIAWTDRVDRRLILPVGLLTYVFKIALIGLMVFAIFRQGWAGFTVMLWGVAAGTAVWITTQAVWTYRHGVHTKGRESQ